MGNAREGYDGSEVGGLDDELFVPDYIKRLTSTKVGKAKVAGLQNPVL